MTVCLLIQLQCGANTCSLFVSVGPSWPLFFCFQEGATSASLIVAPL